MLLAPTPARPPAASPRRPLKLTRRQDSASNLCEPTAISSRKGQKTTRRGQRPNTPDVFAGIKFDNIYSNDLLVGTAESSGQQQLRRQQSTGPGTGTRGGK